MSKGNEEARFPINFEGNASDFAKSVALSASQMQSKINDGNAAIKAASAALRNLKGSSADTAETKKLLQSRIDAEKGALAKATVELVKQAKAESDLAAKSGALSKATDKATTAIKGRLDEAGGAMGLLKIGALGVAAAVVAMAAAVVVGAVALGRFILSGADAARTTRLLNEAAMGGNAGWAKNFSDQVDALADKIPIGRDEITKLGRELYASKIQGTAFVDSLGAISQASAALGDAAGNKIKGFIDRAMVLGRPGLFRVTAQELIGTGLNISEVASALADKMHIGVDAAKKALFEGRVKMADGAAALNEAVTKKFGGINAALAISLPNLAKKFGENLAGLTKGVNLEPLLEAFRDLSHLFSVNTDTGKALKSIVEVFGKDLVSSVSSSTPVVKKFIYGLIEGALDLTNEYLRLRIAARDWFDKSSLKDLDLLSTAFTAGKIAVGALQVGLEATAVVLAGIVKGAELAADAFWGVKQALGGGIVAGKSAGKDLGDGLVNGINAQGPLAEQATRELAKRAKAGFTDELGIASPSKEFEKFGKALPDGVVKGVERGAPGALGAVNDMVQVPSAGSRRGGSSAPLVVNIYASGGNAQDVARELSSPSFLEQLTKAIADAANGAGILVTT